jgi:pyruvate dehydrogenase E2 component (dihydrolipoamide acetyltransferase)
MPEITMPRLSDTMEEGTMGRWRKKVGDAIERGEVVAEIESDKATMDLVSYETGVLEKILAQEGETVAIGRPVAIVGSGAGAAEPDQSSGAPPAEAVPDAAPPADDAVAAVPDAAPPADDAVAAVPDAAPPADDAVEGAPDAAPPADDAVEAVAPGPSATPETTADQPAPVADSPDGDHRKVKASPLARARARDLGVELGGIRGSGEGGRIVRADVEAAQEAGADSAALPAPATASAPAALPGAPTTEQPVTGVVPADVEEIRLSSVRRVAARRLTESIQQTPHFFLTRSVEVDALLALRGDINRSLASAGEEHKVSVNDLLVRACAVALRDNPAVNVSWAGDRILRHLHVNIGVAVATDNGLIVPVIRDADRKSVSEIAREVRGLIDRARAGRLTTQEFSGGTFTISNLGMYGIEHFTAIINPPEAALLAVGGARAQPVVSGEEVVIRQMMALTLAIDHRPLDGASGAQFLQTLVAILENPLRSVI